MIGQTCRSSLSRWMANLSGMEENALSMYFHDHSGAVCIFKSEIASAIFRRPFFCVDQVLVLGDSPIHLLLTIPSWVTRSIVHFH